LKQRWDVNPPTNCQGCHRWGRWNATFAL